MNATTSKISAPAQCSMVRPEFIRLPKTGTRCPFTGLSRTHLNALILPMLANAFKPPVRSISLRKPGTQTGTRLIDYASLLAYLESLAVVEKGAPRE